MFRSIVKKSRHTELVWRYGFNFLPSVNYRLKPAARLSAAAGEVVRDLKKNGIAVTKIEDLLGDAAEFSALDAAVRDILSDRRAEIDRLRAAATDTATIGQKTFNVELLGSPLEFDAADVFARFALQETLLDIAEAYFGMLVKLRYYNVWLTFATDSEARESQLWHFDREDNYILKLFLYLDDVDETAGPFTYAPQTHRRGALRHVDPEYFVEGVVRRSTDEQMAGAVPRQDWITAVGAKGTIVFADTRGFHKGGEARLKDRLMYTCMYTSAASQSKRLLEIREPLAAEGLTRRQIDALRIR